MIDQRHAHFEIRKEAAPLRTISLSQEIYERLRADIRNGTLEPNLPLRMDYLKSRYGIGATPLREALSVLGQVEQPPPNVAGR